MALWTPNNLATQPVGYWDASDSSQLTLNSGNVASIANKGTGPAMAQSTTSAQPALTSNAINSLSAMTFNGSTDFLSAAAAYNQTAAWSFAVLIKPATASGMMQILDADENVSPRVAQYVRCDNGYYDSIAFDSGTNPHTTSTGSGAAVVANTVAMLTGTFDQTTLNLYLNGTLIGSATGSGTGNSGSKAPTIGVYYLANNGTYITYFNGLIGEIVQAPNSWSTSDRQEVEGYMAWKWGTQASLPSSHPYKNAAPTTGSTATLPASPGAFTLTGNPAAVSGTLSASPASFALAGQGASFGSTLAASPGSFAVTGQPSMLVGSVAAGQGAFVISGQPAAFASTGASLPAAPGSFALTGSAATFTGTMSAQPAAFSVTGNPATFVFSTILAASPGAFSVTGQPAAFSSVVSSTITAQPGVFLLGGLPAAFQYHTNLKTLGTSTARSLSAVVFAHDPGVLSDTDLAAFNLLVAPDKPSSDRLLEPLTRAGLLSIPGKGTVRVAPGDVVAVDSTGWLS